jgi:hypothetical protein
MYGDGPFRRLRGALTRKEVLLAQLRGGRSLLLGETGKRVQGTDSTWPHYGEEELEHVLGACPEDVPGVREPEEKALCAGLPAALDYDDGSGGCGAVLPGGLRLGSPVTAAALTSTTTTLLPRCNIKPAQLKAIPSSLRGDCSSFEVLIQCNRIESRVITGEWTFIPLRPGPFAGSSKGPPLPLQLRPAFLWLKILSNQPTEQVSQLYPYNYYY